MIANCLAITAIILNNPASTPEEVNYAATCMDDMMGWAPQFDGNIQFVSVRSKRFRLVFYYTDRGLFYTAVAHLKMDGIDLRIHDNIESNTARTKLNTFLHEVAPNKMEESLIEILMKDHQKEYWNER